MTPTFTSFAAHLAEFIRHGSRHPEGVSRQEPQFDALALALFALQFQHNPAYRTLCTARSLSPANVRHWTQIPSAPTVAFKELELTSLPAGERSKVFYSSGTTGEKPSRHFHDCNSLAVYEASARAWFQRHLLPAAHVLKGSDTREFQFISLTPTSDAAPHSSLVHMFDLLHRTWGAAGSFFAGEVTADGAWALDSQKLRSALESAVRPVLLLGTAFSFVGLLDDLEAQGVRLHLPAGSRALETGGYKGRSRSLLKEELHAFITDRLGIPSEQIVGEYGMSELGSQAYDSIAGSGRSATSESRHFRFPPWARAQIISPETGREVATDEPGLIRIFDLANTRSVLAVQTEDLGIRRGDGFQLLGRAPQSEPRGCSLMPAQADSGAIPNPQSAIRN